MRTGAFLFLRNRWDSHLARKSIAERPNTWSEQSKFPYTSQSRTQPMCCTGQRTCRMDCRINTPPSFYGCICDIRITISCSFFTVVFNICLHYFVLHQSDSYVGHQSDSYVGHQLDSYVGCQLDSYVGYILRNKRLIRVRNEEIRRFLIERVDAGGLGGRTGRHATGIDGHAPNRTRISWVGLYAKE